jgi:predicted DNA-binding transcriptional regulator YafY
MHPLERLLNLVALLLETNRPLTFDQIRGTLEAYGQEDKASAKRQFERDKDTLRQIGIPVETVPTDAWEVEDGYRIPKERYELPDVSFAPEEVAALFVAAHGGGGEATRAFRKVAMGAEGGLLAALEEGTETSGVDASGPRLPEVADAVSGRRRVRFRYRPVTGEEGERDVDAWALLFRGGAWYLVGRDRDRAEPRSFRLSRISSDLRDAGRGEPPPEGFRAADHLQAGPWGLGEPQRTATVAFSPKVAWWALAELPGARTLRTRPDGWTEAEVPAAAGESFVSWVLSFGPDAEVLGPAEARHAVVADLEAVRATV